MENQQKQVIHLYEFEQQSINENLTSKLILDTLKPYFGDKTPQIKIRGRPHKYWAYFEVDPETASKLSQLKTLKIGDQTVNIGRYYHDYQIFINKLDKSITKDHVSDYFKQFGDVVDIVITDPAEKKITEFKHCYIKMKDQKTIDRVVLARLHKLQGKEIKPVRTFGLHEDKESDKKLFLKIEGVIDNIQEFEQKAIQFFMKHGKIRERPKVQNTSNQKSKMIVTFTSPKDAVSAMQAFPNSDWVSEYQKKNINLTLNYFHSKQNKIYVVGLKQNSQKAIKQAFDKYGQISEITLGRTKLNNTLTAVIGFVNENDFKNVLASYLEDAQLRSIFTGKPYITIFLTSEEKKQYGQMKRKQNQQAQGVRPTNFSSVGYGGVPPEGFQMRMAPMVNPGMMPNQGMHPGMQPMQNISGNLSQQPMIPNMGMQGGQFNQPQFNQPQFNQPQFNQGQYNQPTFNQPNFNQAQMGRGNFKQPPQPRNN